MLHFAPSPRKFFHSLVAALLIAVPVLLSGCQAERETEPDGGTKVEFDVDQEKIESELEEAGREIQEGAQELARAVEPEVRRFADDAAITAKIKTKLAADPEINPFTIDVDTVNGQVTLNGVVKTEAQKAEAIKHARQTRGVTEVHCLLQVDPSG